MEFFFSISIQSESPCDLLGLLFAILELSLDGEHITLKFVN